MTTPRLRVSNLAVSTPVISPNGDGRLDTAVMSLTISEPADWRIIVRRPDGRQARQYSGRGSAAAVTWDGRDQKGVIVADGDYTLLASATSPFGAARTVSSKVTVDTMAPTILSINLRPAVLSPNGDGVADVVRLDVKTSEPARGRLSVAKRASATRRYPWTSSIADTQTFAWDGTGVLGDVTSPAPDGRYSLTVEVRDRAGNQTAISRSVRLDRTLGFASVSPAWFSPNGDGRADTAILRFRLFSPAMVRVVIAGAAGSVRTFDLGSRASGSVTVKWNGRGKAGTLLPDGTYRLTATAANAAGRVSLSGRVVVDTTAPVLKVARSLMSSGDSTATISFVASDVGASEVRVWATAQGATDTAARIFTSWVSAGRAHSFEFDPPAPGTYVITLHAEDRACNPAAIARTTLIAP
jgi:flagellar hook assembly protein FlgD